MTQFKYPWPLWRVGDHAPFREVLGDVTDVLLVEGEEIQVREHAHAIPRCLFDLDRHISAVPGFRGV